MCVLAYTSSDGLVLLYAYDTGDYSLYSRLLSQMIDHVLTWRRLLTHAKCSGYDCLLLSHTFQQRNSIYYEIYILVLESLVGNVSVL